MDISMNELYHYGVPGMKWGVRKRSERTFGKSSNKKRQPTLATMDEFTTGRIHPAFKAIERHGIRKALKKGRATGQALHKRNSIKRPKNDYAASELIREGINTDLAKSISYDGQAYVHQYLKKHPEYSKI